MEIPSWLRSSMGGGAANRGTPIRGPSRGEVATAGGVAARGQVDPAETIGAVTDVAALPVQVRRTRVPLLAPDRLLTAAEPAAPEAASAAPAAPAEAQPSAAAPAAPQRGVRLLILGIGVLILALLVFFLIVHHAS